MIPSYFRGYNVQSFETEGVDNRSNINSLASLADGRVSGKENARGNIYSQYCGGKIGFAYVRPATPDPKRRKQENDKSLDDGYNDDDYTINEEEENENYYYNDDDSDDDYILEEEEAQIVPQRTQVCGCLISFLVMNRRKHTPLSLLKSTLLVLVVMLKEASRIVALIGSAITLS